MRTGDLSIQKTPAAIDDAATKTYIDGTWVDYSATSTITGWSSFTFKVLSYRKTGNLMEVAFYIGGASNSTAISFTMPTNSSAISPVAYGGVCANSQDNGTFLTTPSLIIMGQGGNTITCYTNMFNGGWTASGDKAVTGFFIYPIG